MTQELHQNWWKLRVDGILDSSTGLDGTAKNETLNVGIEVIRKYKVCQDHLILLSVKESREEKP